MFLVTKPSAEKIRRFISSQQEQPFSYSEIGATREKLPANYTIDHNRVQLGKGEETYQRAMVALRKWKHFDLGWAMIVPPETPIQAGNTVAMRAQHFGFWSLNACRGVRPELESEIRLRLRHATQPCGARRGALYRRMAP